MKQDLPLGMEGKVGAGRDVSKVPGNQSSRELGHATRKAKRGSPKMLWPQTGAY